MTTIRAREVIHETLVYRFYPWSTNHYPPWIRPDVPNPHGYTVFNQDIYRINSADGTVTAGNQVQSYIRLQVNKFTIAICLHACKYLVIYFSFSVVGM